MPKHGVSVSDREHGNLKLDLRHRFQFAFQIFNDSLERICIGVIFFFFALIFSPLHLSPYLLSGVVGIAILWRYRFEILIFLNPIAFCWFVVNRIEGSPNQLKVLSSFGALGLAFFVYVFWIFAIVRIRRLSFLVGAIVILMIPILPLAFHYLISPQWLIAQDVGRVTVYAYSRGVWFAMMIWAIRAFGGHDHQPGFRSAILAMNPFWNVLQVPVPGDLKPTSLSHAEFVRLQRSGLRLLLGIVLPMQLILESLQLLGERHVWLRVAYLSGTESASVVPLVNELSRAELWLSSLTGGFIYIVGRGMEYGFMVAIARGCGVSLQAEVQNVIQSTRFFDFLKRISFHYVEMLNRIWIVPSLHKINRHIQRESSATILTTWLRTNSVPIAISIGIILGGVTHQWTLIGGSLLSSGIRLLQKSVIESYYYILIAAAVWISIRTERGQSKRSTIRRVFMCFVYFGYFSILLFLLAHSQGVFGNPFWAFGTLARMFGA
jgi:hypothetical protein